MTDDDFDRAAAQADLCRLLAACYYEPCAEFAEERLFGALILATNRIGDSLEAQAARIKESFEKARIEDLLVDYARLFLGTGQTLAPPYESAWPNGKGGNPVDSIQQLIDLYDEGGFVVDPDFRDLPDHIAVELEFLYTLLFRQAAAIKSGDREALDRAKALCRAFFDRHMSIWPYDFLNALRENAQTNFYRDLAMLTSIFLQALLPVLAADK